MGKKCYSPRCLPIGTGQLNQFYAIMEAILLLYPYHERVYGFNISCGYKDIDFSSLPFLLWQVPEHIVFQIMQVWP